jgi:hypothetical protein
MRAIPPPAGIRCSTLKIHKIHSINGTTAKEIFFLNQRSRGRFARFLAETKPFRHPDSSVAVLHERGHVPLARLRGFEALAYGKTMPVATNATEAGRQKSGRAEIKIAPPKQL